MNAARWILVLALTAGVTGAAYACDSAKASTEQASATSGKCATLKAASGKDCSQMAKADGKLCNSAKMAANADHDCVFCSFVSEIKANAGRVKVSTLDTEHGVTVVFAAMTDKDVEIAQAVADKAYTMMNAPAHCSYTRTKMADKSCDGCKEGLGAFADAEVAMEKTDTGASTTVTIQDDKQIEKLHTFFASLNGTTEKAGE